jgi:tetratricopeptide (TPR) repeat protein
MNMGVAYRSLGDLPRAIELLEQAERVFREVDDTEMESRVLGNLSDVRVDSGDYQGAEQECLKALDISGQIGDREAELIMLDRLGWINARLGNYSEAIARSRHALALAREIGDSAMEALVLNNMGQVHWDLGNYREALDACEHSLRMARAKMLRAQDTEALALHTLGLITGSLGDAAAAMRNFQEAERIAGEIGKSSLQMHIRINIGRRLLATGNEQEAVEMLTAELDKAAQARNRELELYALVSLAVAHLHLGGLQRARELSDEATRRNVTIKDRATEVQILKLEAEIAVESECHEEAREGEPRLRGK